MDKNDNIVNMIKSIALKAMNASNPVKTYVGKVISAAPLKVQIDSTFVLESQFLVVPKSLTNYSVNIDINTTTENKNYSTEHIHQYEDSTINGAANKNTESGSFDSTHNHSIIGTKTITFKNALIVR